MVRCKDTRASAACRTRKSTPPRSSSSSATSATSCRPHPSPPSSDTSATLPGPLRTRTRKLVSLQLLHTHIQTDTQPTLPGPRNPPQVPYIAIAIAIPPSPENHCRSPGPRRRGAAVPAAVHLVAARAGAARLGHRTTWRSVSSTRRCACSARASSPLSHRRRSRSLGPMPAAGDSESHLKLPPPPPRWRHGYQGAVVAGCSASNQWKACGGRRARPAWSRRVSAAWRRALSGAARWPRLLRSPYAVHECCVCGGGWSWRS